MSGIDNLCASIPAQARTGKFRLEDALEDELDQFVDWLVTSGKTTATARSYRSYVAKALFMDSEWKDMTSDQRSAVRKLAEFKAC